MGAPRLLEREAELAALDSAVRSTTAAGGTVVMIEGPAGIGKSALLGHAGGVAVAAGMTVARAAGHPLEQDFPFGVALQLFEPLVHRGRLSGPDLLAGAAGLAAPLFGGPAGGAPQAATIVHGLYWLAGNACWSEAGDAEGHGRAARPLAVVVDDAHWADEPSLRFLLYLAQRIEGMPILLVMGRRPHEGGRADALLDELSAGVEVLRPGPLSAAAVGVLVRGHLPGEESGRLAEACTSATGGNPFLVDALLAEVASLPDPPVAERIEGLEALTPRAVVRSVVARLGRLSEEARRLATAAAVLEGGTVGQVAALAGVDVGVATEECDRLAGVEILAAGEPVRFMHPLIRSAIYHDMRPLDRAGAHLRAARVLSEGGAAAELLSAHLMAAPRTGDGWVVETLEQAAASAMSLGTPEVAARLLERAVAEPLPPERRYQVTRALSRAQAAASLPGAVKTLEQALALAEHPVERARVRRSLGRIHYSDGRHRQAIATFEAGLDDLDDPSHPLTAELHSLAAAASITQSLDSRAEAHIAALPDRSESQPPRPRATLLALLAVRATMRGEPADGIRQLTRQAMDAAAPEGGLLDDPLLVSALSLALVSIDDLDLAENLAVRAIDAARARGLVVAYAGASYLRSWPLYLQGRLFDAAAEVEGALETRHAGVAMHAIAGCAALMRCRIELDDLAGARAADELSRRFRPEAITEESTIRAARGEILLAARDPGAALTELAAAGAVLPDECRGLPVTWRAPAAVAALLSGQLDQARELAAEDWCRAERFGTPRARGMARRVGGLVCGGPDGLDLLAEAVTELEASSAHLELARAGVDLGSALRRAGHRKDSRDRLAAALDLADRLGAAAVARQAREELLAAGARPRRAAVSGRDSLTPSEGRVADLAAQGLTNREIAQTLFVTLKAVEGHLASVYRKLGVPGRKELPGALHPTDG